MSWLGVSCYSALPNPNYEDRHHLRLPEPACADASARSSGPLHAHGGVLPPPMFLRSTFMVGKKWVTDLLASFLACQRPRDFGT